MVCSFRYPPPVREKAIEILKEAGYQAAAGENVLITNAPEEVVDKAVERGYAWIPVTPRQAPTVIGGLSID